MTSPPSAWRHPSAGWGLAGWVHEMPACAGMTGGEALGYDLSAFRFPVTPA